MDQNQKNRNILHTIAPTNRRKVFKINQKIRANKVKRKRNLFVSATGKSIKKRKRKTVCAESKTNRCSNYEIADDGYLLPYDSGSDSIGEMENNTEGMSNEQSSEQQERMSDENESSPEGFTDGDHQDHEETIRMPRPSTDAKKSYLFERCFKIVENNNGLLTTKCVLCAEAGEHHKFVKGNTKSFSNFKTHLQVRNV